MNWLKLWHRNNKKNIAQGLVGVELSPKGVAVAHIVTTPEGKRFIKCCDFIEATTHAQQTQKLTQYVHAHGLTGMDSVAALHADVYQSYLMEAPSVEPDEMRSAVKWKVKDLTTLPFEQILVDVFLLPDDAYRGRMKMANVVVTEQSTVQMAAQTLKNAGLNVAAIDITDLALRNIATLCDEDAVGMGLMRLCSNSTLVNVTQQSHLYFTRAIDVGLNTIMDDDGNLQPEKMDILVLEIQRSLDYYESQLGKGSVGRLFVAPLKKPVPGLIDYLNKNLAVNVMMLDFNNLLLSDVVLSDELQAHSLVAIGAALRAEDSEEA